ncbi:hypothetical protein J2741_001711 [Methanolinea mesophila]|uniref:DUF6573 family protein n=1 Tax=Methanolinea mesophila TaxID=547055 RepID=UPI001AEA3B74|nr:DUF6573 family protein [Methanolinea mesophila]MBP1929164.1 hypothetical protein [Methanolinea mesophila]
MDLTTPFSNDEIIFAYTRADAIRDGVLVEIPEDLLKEVGIRVPVAVTQAVWDYLCPEDLDELPGQSVEGRTWDLLWMFSRAAARSRNSSKVLFRIAFLLMNEYSERGQILLSSEPREQLITLKALCGPGDEGEPVITIMLPGED